MKIAIISGIFFPFPGGAQVQTHNLANKLVERKNKVDCYIYSKTNIKNNKYNINIINYFITSLVFVAQYYININLNFIIDCYIKNIIKKKNYNIWYFNFINYKSLILINSLKRNNQKVIVTFQGIDIQKNKKIRYGYRFNSKYDKFLKKTLKNIDIFFAISKNIKKDLISLKVKKSKIFDIPNAVNIEKFRKFSKKKSNTLNLITVARYAKKKKGYDIVPKVAKILLKNKINFKWTIVGHNIHKIKNESFVKKNIKYFNLVSNIENIDEDYFPNSKLIKLYQSSDLYLNLSRIESFGITFIEALASKLPIITFDTKGANEIVKNNYNGAIINNFNNKNYVQKIIFFNKNKIFFNKIKLNSTRSIKKYDLELVTNNILKIFKKI